MSKILIKKSATGSRVATPITEEELESLDGQVIKHNDAIYEMDYNTKEMTAKKKAPAKKKVTKAAK